MFIQNSHSRQFFSSQIWLGFIFRLYMLTSKIHAAADIMLLQITEPDDVGKVLLTRQNSCCFVSV